MDHASAVDLMMDLDESREAPEGPVAEGQPKDVEPSAVRTCDMCGATSEASYIQTLKWGSASVCLSAANLLDFKDDCMR